MDLFQSPKDLFCSSVHITAAEYIYGILGHPFGGVYKMILLISRSNLQFGPDSSNLFGSKVADGSAAEPSLTT